MSLVSLPFHKHYALSLSGVWVIISTANFMMFKTKKVFIFNLYSLHTCRKLFAFYFTKTTQWQGVPNAER